MTTTSAIAELDGVTGPESENARAVARIILGDSHESWVKATKLGHKLDMLTGAFLMAAKREDRAYFSWLSDSLWAFWMDQHQEAM